MNDQPQQGLKEVAEAVPMSDIERCWTVFIDTFGRAFDVEDGVSPHAGATARDGSEVVAVVPAEQLRGAVSRAEDAERLLRATLETQITPTLRHKITTLLSTPAGGSSRGPKPLPAQGRPARH
jgi:hypothetical protein